MRHKLLVKAPAAGENRTHPKAGPVGTIGGLAAGLLAGAAPTFFAIAVFAIAFFAIASPAIANPATASTAATSPAAPYPAMAPIEAYLMDRSQEIALARTAAPGSISKDATILVMTRKGYETAIAGSNGFVCWVGRGFVGASDAPERWNPKIRAADCENPQAARTIVPLAKLRTAMILAGHTDADTIGRIRTALSTGEIPPLESGAMSYMMSKSSYLTDQGSHDMPHLMFFVAVDNPTDWGANAPDTPIIGGNYWFFTPGHEAETAGLPPLSVFLTGVANWSDGTPASAHPM